MECLYGLIHHKLNDVIALYYLNQYAVQYYLTEYERDLNLVIIDFQFQHQDIHQLCF